MRQGALSVGVAVLVGAFGAGGTPTAYAAGGHKHGGTVGSPAGSGIDVAYPQCPATSLPAGEAFGIIGVNGGLANDYNGCLTTEFRYASALTATTSQPPASTYLNTGDPGNGVADWPSPSQPGAFATSGTSNPYGACGFASGTSGAGAVSNACAWQYGFDMVAGISFSGGSVAGDLTAFSQATGKPLYAQPVWLDVETGNSWQSGSTGSAMNTADLQGMVAALQNAAASASAPSPSVGIYSTAYQWGQIAGSAPIGTLTGLPEWLPGATGESGAQSNCSATPFTGAGGRIVLTQWTGTYDYDYPCP